MNAREDHSLEYYDLDIYGRLNKIGRIWVVTKNDIVCRDPTWLMEKVLIQTRGNNYTLGTFR